MSTLLNPYLNFRTEAREAMEFYRSVFGGELDLSTFAELGGPDHPDEGDKIMHAQLETPAGFTLMAADTPDSMEFRPGTNFSVSLSGSGDDDAELRGYWDKLSAGAQIDQPLATAPWGASFGMLTDRFGIHWLVNISADAA
jgi:PhnB protein